MRSFTKNNTFFQTFCLLFLTKIQKYVHSSICCDKDSKKYMYKPNHILSKYVSLKTSVARLLSNLRGSNVNTSMCSKMNIGKRLKFYSFIY